MLRPTDRPTTVPETKHKKSVKQSALDSHKGPVREKNITTFEQPRAQLQSTAWDRITPQLQVEVQGVRKAVLCDYVTDVNVVWL